MKLKLNELLASSQHSHEPAVTSQVPVRVNFKRSNTCGSFFAQCQCREPHSIGEVAVVASKSLSLDATSPLSRVPSILISGEDLTKSPEQKVHCDNKVRKESDTTKSSSSSRGIKKQPSFTHPDTPVIFTEKNRYPDPVSAAEVGRRASREIIIDDGNKKIEVKHSRQQRASSPNIIETAANFCYDIHPEFKLQIVPKTSCSNSCGSHLHSQHFQHFHHQHNHLSHHRLLKKHSSKSKSFPSVIAAASSSGRSSSASLQQRSFDSDITFSSYSVDEETEDAELNENSISELLATDLNESSTSLSSSTLTSQSSKSTTVEASSTTRKQQQNASGEQVVQQISAAQYFQVC